jgi:hypothetical protein
MTRPQKITLGEVRQMGIRGLLIYCSDYHCSHNVEINADRWPDHVRLSDLEPLFTCQACGIKGAEVRDDFNWASNKTKTAGSPPNCGTMLLLFELARPTGPRSSARGGKLDGLIRPRLRPFF